MINESYFVLFLLIFVVWVLIFKLVNYSVKLSELQYNRKKMFDCIIRNELLKQYFIEPILHKTELNSGKIERKYKDIYISVFLDKLLGSVKIFKYNNCIVEYVFKYYEQDDLLYIDTIKFEDNYNSKPIYPKFRTVRE